MGITTKIIKHEDYTETEYTCDVEGCNYTDEYEYRFRTCDICWFLVCEEHKDKHIILIIEPFGISLCKKCFAKINNHEIEEEIKNMIKNYHKDTKNIKQILLKHYDGASDKIIEWFGKKATERQSDTSFSYILWNRYIREENKKEEVILNIFSGYTATPIFLDKDKFYILNFRDDVEAWERDRLLDALHDKHYNFCIGEDIL